MMKKIRVLYVGYTLIGDKCATGNTLQNIFNACSNIKTMQYCLDYTNEYHNITNETVYFSKIKSLGFFILKSLYRKNDNRIYNKSESVEVNRIGGNCAVAVARAVLDILPKRLGSKSYKIIDEFAPDIVYTTGENITTLKQALLMSNRYNIPIILHLMDNTEDSVYSYFSLTKMFRRKYLNYLEKVYKKSKYNIAISQKMADEFSKRHDVRFGFAMNCISELHKSPMVNNKPLRFVFSGGLHGGRAEMLKEIGEVIADSNYLVNKLILEVYTSAANVAYYKNLNGNVIRIKEYVPRNQMFQNLSSADVLVHCESFDKNEMEFFEYSMTTKIPEYLSVGRPILCYGPREICSVSYIEDNGVGIVANDRNSLERAITILCDNDELRNSLGEKALLVAQRDHMSSEVCVRVENIIKSGIELWRNC